MKNIYIINGTMGVGKTTTCQSIKKKLNNSVFLDGDWCWDMNPFYVTDETKKMVIENICFLLNNFIKCSVYDNIIFCWVLHEQTIIDDMISRLDIINCRMRVISLVCSEEALDVRLRKDISMNVRTENMLQRSFERMSCYEGLNTFKVDVSEMTPEQAADFIIQNYQNL